MISVTSGRIQAWITSAVDEKSVEKAIVLAGSLRRVRTAKKVVVYTTLAVSKELREKLKEVFDLVLLLDKEIPNGLSLDDYAKVQGFFLSVFNKCVYLTPNALMLKNCDEIFEKYTKFAALKKDPGIDSSVYLFAPSLMKGRALEKVMKHYVDVGDRPKGSFSKYFNLWISNNIKHPAKLDSKYCLPIDLDKTMTHKSLDVDASIVSFMGTHPLDMSEGALQSKMIAAGCIEKFAVEKLLQIFSEDITNQAQLSELGSSSIAQSYGTEPIAIVGLSFRLPGGNNVDEFWDLLVQGKEAIQTVPPHRWTKEHTSKPCKDRKFQAGFLNVPIDEFDAKFFGISPKEATFLDPQQRLLHEVSWEAMEDAMIDPQKLHGTNTGVFVGSWVRDYKDIVVESADVDFFRAYMGNSIASGAARLSHFLGTTGPSIATESGCSSAIVAVHMACKSLREGETNLALACGVNLLINPQDKSTLSFVVSPDGRCKTFDQDANGFGRAEACAVLIMKRYSDALRDGEKLWGLIRSTAITQEGISKSLGTPTIHCESLAMELALKDANLKPSDVSFLETHGTGTPVGDPMEIAAITKAYGKDRVEPLIIGSVKTNVGHTESCSGITGIIKVLLSMKNEVIPPHLNLKKLNPKINLDAIPAKIPLETTPWPRNVNRVRIAGVSSFGISGTDGHAILEEPPTKIQSQINFIQERPLHIIKFSAKCAESLTELLSKYEGIFSEKADETENGRDFADMAYSANYGRSTFNLRAVIVAENFAKAAKILQEKSYKQVDIQTGGSSLCFLFTGQGSQYPNMAASLYETSPIFKVNFDMCSELLLDRYGISISEQIWGKTSSDKLSQTLYSQTSIFCVEYCLLKMWESWGVRPDYVLGHSLGEFAAAVAAQLISFEDALMLVAERSKLIDKLSPGKMLVIKADKKSVEKAIAQYKLANPMFWVDFAALNSSDQTVVAGDSSEIQEFARFCKEQQLKCIILASSHAFHSRHMDPIIESYKEVALKVNQIVPGENAPKYISGMDGKLVAPEEMDADYWVRHAREKVSFIEACRAVESEGCGLFVEVGPHPVLSALVMSNIEGQSVTCLPSLRRTEDEWATMLDSLSKLYLSEWRGEIDWKGFDKHYQRKQVSVPFYPFNRKSIWVKTRKHMADLHPLLGKVIPNASGCSVYEQSLTLKKADFAQDHIIGNTIVFPGAGFLEMCLVGGHSSVQGFGDSFYLPRRPVTIKSLKIKSPLALAESQLCVLQTVVTLNKLDEEMVYNVTISRLDESDSSNGGLWREHASAKFFPVGSSLPFSVGTVNIKTIQETWRTTDTADFYETLPEVGLRFGPKFQSLQSGWRSEEQGILVKVKIPENATEYLLHPVITDAMIQATMLWTSKDKVKRKLQVPVHIGEFTWLDCSSSADLYIYCSTPPNGTTYSLLVDSSGKPLAYMSSVDLAETTVKLVEGMIHQQHTAMPYLWEEIWKPTIGPMERRLEHVPQRVPEEVINDATQLGKLSEKDTRSYLIFCDMTNYYLLDALYKLGWEPKPHAVFTCEELMTNLRIQVTFKPYINFFLNHMKSYGFFDATADPNFFRVTSKCPTSEDVVLYFNKIIVEQTDNTDTYNLMQEIGKNFTEILVGRIHPLKVLFPPDESSKPSAKKFYAGVFQYWKAVVNTVNTRFLNEYVAMIKAVESEEKPIIRVLEIGAGTGTFTADYLECLSKTGLNVEYNYTDISAAFFDSAQVKFEQYTNFLTFKKFNMCEDPFEQGYSPEYFDLIIGFEVLHVAKRIKPMLGNLRSLLRPSGFMHFYETVKRCPRVTFLFGLLEDYWQFEDTDLRPDHIALSEEEWTASLKACGFPSIQCVPIYNDVHSLFIAQASSHSILKEPYLNIVNDAGKSWIVFNDGSNLAGSLIQSLISIKRNIHEVTYPTEITEDWMHNKVTQEIQDIHSNRRVLEGILYFWSLSETREQARISLPFVSVIQQVVKLEKPPKVFVVTKGIYGINGSEVPHPAPGSLIGIVKAVRNEYNLLKLCQIDLPPGESSEYQEKAVFANLWADNDGIIGFRDGSRFVPKITSHKNTNDLLTLPNGCDRFQLVLPETKLISDLEFAYLPQFGLEDNEVEVHTKAFALNFRDVFTVLKPVAEFEQLNTLGIDWAGVVTRTGRGVTKVKVGDRVVGMSMKHNVSLPSHVKIEEDFVAPIPSEMTFSEGVTLPAVYFTAVHCLLDLAKMKTGETLLIHTASGGVGLCAIQLAQRLGVNIIATAGSPAKRNFLKSVGIKHVFNSRTLDFGQQILEVTQGQGVDIVLNSITGPGVKEASLEALARNGRFIEMSVLNVWTKEQVAKLRPDVTYEIVYLPSLSRDDFQRLTVSLRDSMRNGTIKPIAYERFDALNIRGALYYLQKAKHIGKIVIHMPEVAVENAKFVVTTKLFNEQSTYLVTGGLGGIGYEVVKWMLRNGAKHVAIASRSPPKPEVSSQITAWNKSGKHVEAFQIDIGDFSQCKQLLETFGQPGGEFPKLRGIMHAAGVLQDATIDNQSWDKFKATQNAKVSGSWHLHDLTKDMLLEHFVLFSSIAAVLGSPGQGNHSGSNSFQDTLIRYRRSCGLPGLTVNWGNWGETGVATEVDFPGIRPISTNQGLLALGTFLTTQQNHVVVMNVESFGALSKIFPNLKTYIADKRLLGETSKVHVAVTSDEFWSKVDAAAENREERLALFKTFVKSIVRVTLKMDQDEDIDDQTEFQVLGVDSLMMLEMKNGLQNVLGNRITLTAAQLKDCSNTFALANKLVEILDGESRDSTDVQLPTEEELFQLLLQDSLLPERIQIPAGSSVPDASKIETILLTGVTGSLGPYLLRDLSQRDHVRKIICLIRKSGKTSPKDRLTSRLKQTQLLEEVKMEKVVCINGDIADERLGMKQDEYDRLAAEVDCIFHSAVRADHTSNYVKMSGSRKLDVRTVNVGGSLKLLEFATHTKLKHFYNASTLLVAEADDAGCLSENWVSVEAFRPFLKVNPGYPMSKLVSELLIKKAVERGVPAKVFRFGLICGDSRTGRCDLEGNHLLLRWLAYMKLGCMPEEPAPYPVMAVDHCAALSIKVFFDENAENDVYNVCMRNAGIEQTFIQVAKDFGIDVEPIPLEQFMNKMQSESDDSPLAMFKEIYKRRIAMFMDTFETTGLLVKYVQNSQEFFMSRKLLRLYPDYEINLDSMDVVMKRDLAYLKELGVFEKFGIKS